MRTWWQNRDLFALRDSEGYGHRAPMSTITDFIQASGAIIAAPASAITAVMLWLQWKDRRESWLPGIELDAAPSRSQRLYRPDAEGKVRIQIVANIINETKRTVIVDSVSLKSPHSVHLIFNDGGGDLDAAIVRVGAEIPPGNSPISIDAYSDGSATGLDLQLSFEISRKSRDKRPKSLTVSTIIH